MNILYVCQSVSQSLISLPIGHFWGSTSETSGLVSLYLRMKQLNFRDKVGCIISHKSWKIPLTL